MMHVGICTPSSGSVKATYCASLLGLVTHFLNNVVVGREDEPRSCLYDCIIGSIISAQREQLVDDVLRDPGMTHVLFIDDDMGCRGDCLNLALSRRMPIVLANYRRKASPWEFTARRMDGGRAIEVPTNAGQQGLEEISFGGFGFALIETQVIRKLVKPRFLCRWIEHQQLYSTEDYPFFQAIHDAGLAKVYVDHDLSHRVFHIGDFAFKHDMVPTVTPRAPVWQEMKSFKDLDERPAA